MKHIIDLKDATLVNAEITKSSDDTIEAALQIAPESDAFDDHSGESIDTALWADIGTNTEGAFLGTNCIKLAGPTTPAWDVDGIIYKPPVVVTTTNVGLALTCQLILEEGGTFAVGLQEYAFTVDDIGTPTTWTMKFLTAQSADNSTYVVFESGRIVVYRGGIAGERKVIADSAWTVSETGAVKPIYVTFWFSSNGYEIVVNQPQVWSEPKTIHTEVRSLGTHPAAGYSFCVNKFYSDSLLGFYGLSNVFKTGAQANAYVLVEDTAVQLMINTLQANPVIGGLVKQDGSVSYQFPKVSQKWFTQTELALSQVRLTGQIAHEIRFKLTQDAVIEHPVTIDSYEATT